MTIEIRQLARPEVAELLLWAKAEGWNPGIDDAAPFHAADPAGFIGCLVDGEMAAGISAVASGPDFGFVGLYIAHPAFRGRGYGRKVWDAGMARLGSRVVGLDGVPSQQENYRRMGFMPAYRTWRYSGRFMPTSLDPSVVAVGTDRHPSIAEFDRRYFPGPRPNFLAKWLDARHIVRAILREGRIAGYGVMRKCHDGYKIGPLFAGSENDAGLIFMALCACSDGGTVSIDVPAPSAGFSLYLADIAFERSFDTMRMYRGAPPDIDMTGIFGVTTLELG